MVGQTGSISVFGNRVISVNWISSGVNEIFKAKTLKLSNVAFRAQTHSDASFYLGAIEAIKCCLCASF